MVTNIIKILFDFLILYILFFRPIKKDTKPFYARPYDIPVRSQKVFKEALQKMEQLGVIEKVYDDTEWASPTFGTPKSNGAIRGVSDFRRLNQAIKRSLWPIPTIRELLHTCGGMTYATALDQIMGYWEYL